MRSRVWWVATAVAVAMGAVVPVAVSALERSGRDLPPKAKANRPVEPSSSLPSVATGERPGPAVLYADAPAAPQLENRHSAFVAPFDRVSGTDRYVDGEYFYTDHLYDDGGDGLDYPADRARYGDNAADLVELRISTRKKRTTHYRFTLNTLLVADSTIAVVAFDTDGDDGTGSSTLPGDPGTPFPGTDAVLSTWGTGAAWSTWTGDAWATTSLPATADLDANQITVAVPDAVGALPGEVRAMTAVGLHDPTTNGFLRPDPEKSGVYNVGFRFDEAILESSAAPDEDQAAALAADDISAYRHTLDFDALRAKASHTTVPTSGTLVRFFPSRIVLGEGRDLDEFPAQLGQLQPYSVHVPTSYDGRPVGLTLDLHSLGQRHWQYNGSTGVQQLSEGRDSIVATADARGEDGWYQHEAEYDVFEMWNDIARHYALDPDSTAITGYSMGGYATYRLGTLYPDLFGSAVSVVGPPGDGIWLGAGAPTGGAETLTNLWLENARNLPYMNIVAAADELVPISGTTQQNVGPAYNGRTSFDALGYRYAFDVYPAAEHLTLAVLGYNLPQAAAFLGDARVDRDPFHVTFAYTPAADAPELGLVHDHAYWVSDVRVADETVGVAVSSTADPIGKGAIDVESLARGIDDPEATKAQTGGTVPLPYVETSQSWGEPPARAAANTLVVKLTNIGSATIDLARAGIDPSQPIEVQWESDAAATLTLVAADGTTSAVAVTPGAGTTTTGATPPGPTPPPPDVEPSPTVSQPTVIGPIGDEGIRTKEPFFTTLLPLPEGWVEEEFFYEGVAQTPDEMAAGTPGTTAYRSRIMVRRPSNPADFNGTVVVDWNNVTVPQDRDVAWHPLYHTLLARGYAYVSVAAQRLSIEASPLALKQYDPVRYGSLSHPGDDYSFDIFTQAAEAVLSEEPSVLGALRPHVTHRLAMGASQSGGRLKTYINEVQEHAGVFDGFQPQISGPGGVRRDLVPVVWVNSGSEADDVDETPPDSELFRLWEIAGTAHTSHGSSQLMNDNLRWNHSNGMSGPKEEAHDIEDSFAWGYQLDPGECVRENFSVAGLTWSAALVALDTWVKTGVAPPPMPRLARDADGRVHDEHGNMVGGVRAPYLDVPIATYYGGDVPDGNLDPCANVGGRMALSGYTRVFSASALDALYASAEDYVTKLDAAIEDALAKGFILPEGAAEMRARAPRAAAILDRADGVPTIPGGA